MKKIFVLIILFFPVPCLAQMPFQRIHFATGSDRISASEALKLESISKWLGENEDVVFVLEGHCDERGSANFNMELGDRRAHSVKGWLIENGINPVRIIMLVSYGKEFPLDPSHNSRAWRLNRRVEFVVR